MFWRRPESGICEGKRESASEGTSRERSLWETLFSRERDFCDDRNFLEENFPVGNERTGRENSDPQSFWVEENFRAGERFGQRSFAGEENFTTGKDFPEKGSFCNKLRPERATTPEQNHADAHCDERESGGDPPVGPTERRPP